MMLVIGIEWNMFNQSYIYMYRLPAFSFFRTVMVTTFKPQVCAKKGMVAAARGLLCNSAGLFQSGHGIDLGGHNG